MSTLTAIEITKGRNSLEQLQKWLPRAKHDEPENGNMKYTDNADLDANVKPLLEDLGLQRLGFTVWRVSTRTTIRHKTTGAGYLIPIHIISGKPSLGPACLQIPGHFTKYETEVDLTPEIDCVFVVPVEKP